MAIKKLSLLTGLMILLFSGLYAQIGTSYDVRDSSLIRKHDLPQHNEFLNNAYPFPAKPRNQWEIGVKGGLFSVSGDVRSQIPTGGFGVHVRKALGYVFSVRGEYTWGRARGLNFQPSFSYRANDAWSKNGYTPGVNPVFYNYKTTINEGSLQGVVTLNNLRFHKSKTGVNAYLFAGLGGYSNNTKINARKGTGTYVADFQNIYNKYVGSGFKYSNRKDIRSDIKDVLDDSYETDAQEDPGQPTFKPVLVLGAGMQFKLSNKFNIALEDKFSMSKSDLIDGQQWQDNGTTQTAQTRDFDTYNFLSLGLNYNLGAKRTEPLYWLNPLDYAYNELNAPRHMKLPKPVLDDADGDGVTDQFDLEPNTPQGCPVDTHGVSKDTDGDGVPDCKDKELITPTQCQPVDADGVGKCPEPACCKELAAMAVAPKGCTIGDLPSVSFASRSVALSNDAKAVLASAAQKMRDNPACKVAVVGYGESSKAAQQLSWDRVNTVINHLVEKEGISADRFVFKYGEGNGDANTVDLRDGTSEEGPNTVPAPHPNLKSKK